ncbi:S8 family serine peptidase [Syntrophotalea acetylenica]|uniref:S8 family serine peptidase n=1 Tax=Syntrophotalea acetylenica TaxID=29542 RepID=UPI002A3600D4|nr:S8 family serine peptidase [Syntrophotalea acetylenica]MDY0263336.1 S8 family serine peptidase [Syntrophotalea acetylenica]
MGFVYEHALKGFSIAVPAQALPALKQNPKVNYVATDDVRYAFAQSLPTGIARIYADLNNTIDIDGVDDWRVDVDVAVIDTGVDFQHPDLNVVGGINCSGGNPIKAKCETGGDDDHYHGTHVAGTIGALDNGIGVVGVAPGARLWAVKVLNSSGSGYTSWIVAGIDWVAANADKIEVANMSLGGSGWNQAEYDAIQGAVKKGVAFAVAAGNSGADANNYSPAAFDNVLTVSALADFDGLEGGYGDPTCRVDLDDTLADFSNWGSAVNLAAPGVCILSTFPLEQGEYGTISGTSMASPHVAGALALLASRNNPDNATDVATLYNQVISQGNFNWSDDSGDGVQEALLDVGDSSVFAPLLVAGSGSGPAPTNNPPTADIANPTDGASFDSGATITFTGTASDMEDGDLTDTLSWASDVDGPIGTGGSFSAILSGGLHTITASVADSGGLTGSTSIAITVDGSGGDTIVLNVAAYKVRGTQYADLTWNGAASSNVDVYRNGDKISTTPNDEAYTDGPLGKGGGSATYQVCESDTLTCSNIVPVIW